MEHQKYMSREKVAEYVTSFGLPLTKGTLQKWATVGGGPPYKRFGRSTVYLKEDVDAWIKRKLNQPANKYRPEDDSGEFGDA